MATHHWIPRAARHSEDYQVVPAGWSDIYNEWHEAVVGDISHAKFGLLELLKACERLEIDPETADDRDWARSSSISTSTSAAWAGLLPTDLAYAAPTGRCCVRPSSMGRSGTVAA